MQGKYKNQSYRTAIEIEKQQIVKLFSVKIKFIAKSHKLFSITFKFHNSAYLAVL